MYLHACHAIFFFEEVSVHIFKYICNIFKTHSFQNSSVQIIPRNKTQFMIPLYGINRPCVLNELRYFHIIDGAPGDSRAHHLIYGSWYCTQSRWSDGCRWSTSAHHDRKWFQIFTIKTRQWRSIKMNKKMIFVFNYCSGWGFVKVLLDIWKKARFTMVVYVVELFVREVA